PRARRLPRRQVLPLAADPPPRRPSPSREVGAAHGSVLPQAGAAAEALEAGAPQGEVREAPPAHGCGRGRDRDRRHNFRRYVLSACVSSSTTRSWTPKSGAASPAISTSS